MGNDRDSSDDGARDEGAANDDTTAAPPEARKSAADATDAPVHAKSKIEVVTPAEPRPAARRLPRNIVQLGPRKPKSYLN